MSSTKPVEAAAPAAASSNASVTSGEADLSNKTISSPHELTDWVDGLLDTLQSRFDVMQTKVDDRMTEMARRIDSLETSIEELIQGQNNA